MAGALATPTLFLCVCDVGGQRTESAEEVLFARQKFVAESRAYGLQAIDMVAIDYKSKYMYTQ